MTLTYNNEHLPEDGSIRKAHLQNFFKRLRLEVKPISYLACGEYGELKGRPHYHAIIFGCSVQDTEILEEAWGQGNVYVGTVTYNSARYVAGYLFKKYDGQLAKDIYGDKTPPFRLSSKGLGKRWALSEEKKISNDEVITIKGVPCSTPRYYRKVLNLKYSDEELNMRAVARANEREELFIDRNVPLMKQREMLEQMRAQQNLNQEARARKNAHGKL